MKREKEVEGKRVVILMMVMMVVMVMGCNSGGVGEGEEGKNKFLQSLVNVSNEFLNVFTSFGEMVRSVLGLNLESKKSDVGNYFKKVQETVQGIKDGLKKIVNDMKEEGNPNAEATATAVKTLVEGTLDKIIEGAKTASESIGDAGGPIANVATGDAGGIAGSEVDSLVKGIKSIVEVVLKEGKHDAGTEKKADDLGARAGNADGEAVKLFANDNAGNSPKKTAADAAKAVGAVTGADILKAIVKDGGDAAKLAKSTAAAVATAKKDAVIAGGIALRAMSKDGKFASKSGADEYAPEVKGAAISAVTKALDTLTIAIRKTMDLGLKNIKKAMKININGTSVASDKSSSNVNNQ
ncbi:variable large family protein [Borrelia crocidurae]|uniref:Variable large protein n=1 Tax=Borrelia crocidurae (strain Achema) TaxID=1155096 RepID=I0FEU7_BORCA|nr:variable large family protein [Borrelia crocidurae]AFI32003.1 Vlp protein, gamma subfamily [Borrelia crocidurae str. Achema]